MSILALADNVLKRNTPRNTGATDNEKERNKQVQKTPSFVAYSADDGQHHKVVHGTPESEPKQSAGNDWAEIKDDPQSIEAYAYTVATRKMREQGEVPADYTSIINCEQCGKVPMWKGFPKESHSCVWCFNRISGKPMPAHPIEENTTNNNKLDKPRDYENDN